MQTLEGRQNRKAIWFWSALATSGLSAILALTWLWSSRQNDIVAQQLPIKATVEIGGRMFYLEVARTKRERQIGLMGRSQLAPQRGMLFIFEGPEKAKFWMKDTKIALDMIFVSRGQVVDVVQMAPPCKTTICQVYGGEKLADSVIEVAGGTWQKLGLSIGHPIQIKRKE
ncbi:DUF192 domain-containing protein [Gloeobacter morelensis]|uniref:DUF192 domain-containing protein n=1 Tax=Gloeobacter morelensis TaxID=2907343 RepID=UPI001E343CE3|nr:DUF192 domain-containing protein [Gloeobacter morelensis]UFP97240.1 DUF192 domain-containing protein [Gloeobacter morelensis MG652769]